MKGTINHSGTQVEPALRLNVEMDARHERTWSVLAHLSIFVNLFTGVLGPVVALAIWVFSRQRSRKVARAALRSAWHQVAWMLMIFPVGWFSLWVLALALSLPETIFSPLTLALAWAAVPLAQGAWAARKVSQGEDYRYPSLARLGNNGKSTGRHNRRHGSHHVDGDLFEDDGWDDGSDFGDDGGDSGGDLGGDCGGGEGW